MNDKTSETKTQKSDSDTNDERVTQARGFHILPKSVSLKAMREYIANLSFFAVVILTGLVSYKTFTDKAVQINPIEVPSDLVAKGFTRVLVPKRIADEIRAIQVSASTIKEGSKLAPDLGEIEIQIPGSSVSISSVVDEVGSFLGFDKREIDGEITRTETGYSIRLRMPGNGDVFDVDIDATTSKAVDGLIRNAAHRILESIDPFMISAYHFGEGDYEKSREYIARTMEQGSRVEKAWALNLLGVIETDNFQTSPLTITSRELALRHVELAIKLRPDFALPYLTRANIHHSVRNFPEAIASYERAAELNPNLPNLHRNWGLLLVKQRKFDPAVAILKSGWKLRPDDTTIGHLLAESHFRKRQLPQSIAILNQLKEQDPTDPVTRYFLAAVYELMREEELMRSESDAAAYLDPNGSLKPEILR